MRYNNVEAVVDEMHAFGVMICHRFAMDKKSTGRNLSIFGK